MPTRRGKKWVSRPTIDGKTVWGRTFATKREALDHEAELRTKPKPGVRETAESFARRWVRDFRPKAEPMTRRKYEHAAEVFAQEFGAVPLGDLPRGVVRDWAAEQSYSVASTVKSMLKDAQHRDRLRENPLDGFALPARDRQTVRVPTRVELDRLATAALEEHGAFGPTVRALIVFAAYQAMRPGEIACLERTDIDRRAMTVRVTKNLDRTGGVKPYTKNHGTRTILLLPEALDVLDSFPPPFNRLVFATPRGRMFSQSNLSKYWDPVRDRAGLGGVQFRSLRHFGATHLLELGNTAADVAFHLGHSDGGRLVMERYGHPERSAMERLRASAWAGGASVAVGS